MNCIYEAIEVHAEGTFYRCAVCQHERVSRYAPHDLHRPCGEGSVSQVIESAEAPSGVGTELKRILETFGITTGSCNCTYHEKLMNAKGPDWCAANVDMIVGWLKEEATKRGLPFVTFAVRLLVMEAIRQARKAS